MKLWFPDCLWLWSFWSLTEKVAVTEKRQPLDGKVILKMCKRMKNGVKQEAWDQLTGDTLGSWRDACGPKETGGW